MPIVFRSCAKSTPSPLYRVINFNWTLLFQQDSDYTLLAFEESPLAQDPIKYNNKSNIIEIILFHGSLTPYCLLNWFFESPTCIILQYSCYILLTETASLSLSRALNKGRYKNHKLISLIISIITIHQLKYVHVVEEHIWSKPNSWIQLFLKKKTNLFVSSKAYSNDMYFYSNPILLNTHSKYEEVKKLWKKRNSYI